MYLSYFEIDCWEEVLFVSSCFHMMFCPIPGALMYEIGIGVLDKIALFLNMSI